MLDECKGDKFEETISAFAMIVLRKNAKNTDDPIRRVLTGHTNPDHVLPLILAYRSSLRHNLDKRNALRRESVEQNQRLDIVEQDLERRIAEARSMQEDTEPAMAQELETLVNMNWIGDRRWADILLHGPSIRSVFGTSDAGGLTRLSEHDSASSNSADPLLHELDTKIKKHQSRLAEWKMIAKDLEVQRANTVKAVGPPVKPQAIGNQFAMHKKLHVANDQTTLDTPRVMTTPFQTLLDTMRQELYSKSKAANSPVGRRNSTLDKSGAFENEITENSHQHVESPTFETFDHDSQEQKAVNKEAVPVLHSDQDDSLKQVDVQHSPFPSSPMSSLFDGPSSSWIPEHKSSATPVKIDSPNRESRPESPISRRNSNKAVHPPSSPTKDWLSLLDRTRASMASFNTYKHPLDSDPIDQSTDIMNLDEKEEEDEVLPFSSTPPLSSTENNKATLLERTRQSMSLFSNSNINPKIRPRNSTKPRDNVNRSSNLFPTNQFESPQSQAKTPVLNLAYRETEPNSNPNSFSSPFNTNSFSRSSTPRDKLFEEEADYASVFKSRPKIAVSPLLSPQRDRFEFGRVVDNADHDGVRTGSETEIGIEMDMERLKLDSKFQDKD